jgi:hypothetical protein
MPPKTPPGGPRPDRPPAPRNDHRDAFQRGTTVSSAEDQMGRTFALEEGLDALRIHFEQYFLGLVRKPPTQERAAIRAAILQLKSSFVRNTAVKFRVNALHNRFLSYERMWDRTIREMEEGTYRRDLFKARLRRGHAEEGATPGSAARRAATSPGGAPDDDFDVDEDGPEEAAEPGMPPATATARARAGSSASSAPPGSTGSIGSAPAGGPVPIARAVTAGTVGGAPAGGPVATVRAGVDSAAGGAPAGGPVTNVRAGVDSAAGGAPPAGSRPRPIDSTAVAASRPGATRPPSAARSNAGADLLDDARIRTLHAAYVEARRRCRETTDGITVEAIGAALRKQVPELLARHGARSVDFQVVVKDGKAVLKAFPR